MEVRFVVPGEPVPKGRPRFGNGRTYTPEATRNYEEWVRWHARTAMRGKEMLAGPLALRFKAVYAIPASWSKKRVAACLVTPEWKVTKPDVDNLAKLAADACNGVVYRDDGQIAVCECVKVWGVDPRVDIEVSEL